MAEQSKAIGVGERAIGEFLRLLFPYGTNGAEFRTGVKGDISNVPLWPPDLFAAAASLAQTSGCYTHPSFVSSRFPTESRLVELQGLAAQLRRKAGDAGRAAAGVDSTLNELWGRLVEAEGAITDCNRLLREQAPPDWCTAAMELLIVADEASAGLGFTAGGSDDPAAQVVRLNQRRGYFEEHRGRTDRVNKVAGGDGKPGIEIDYDITTKILERHGGDEVKIRLADPLVSLCCEVPSHLVCVQPKTSTPQVGFSVRSLSHNLALLPGKGDVTTYWFDLFPPKPEPDDNRINLLLIPYPYHLDGSCFVPVPETADAVPGRRVFRIDQRWVRDPDELIAGIRKLIEAAEEESGHIDGIVLPELALDHATADKVSMALFQDERFGRQLEFFISGVTSERVQLSQGEPTGVRGINSVYTNLKLYWEDKTPTNFRRIQVKHHRWKLDYDQIVRYHLGAQLDPSRIWWEDNDIVERENLFWVFRPGMVMSTLVCEDLARVDPVQNVLRAVGPNLVIALLMDGPQLDFRWATRYATGLGDDPGCGVLTLTSLGMIRRSHHEGGDQHRQIAVWKDYSGRATALKLPEGAAALVITLSAQQVNDITSGGRPKPDEDRPQKLVLTARRPVPTPKLPVGARGATMFSSLDRSC